VKKYDLIVAGGGPAGLLAATAAARAGLRVALLERKRDLCRLERLCGQTIVSMNEYYFDDLACYSAERSRLSFLRSGLSFPYTGPAKNLYAWHIYSPDGRCLPLGAPQKTRQRGDGGAVGLAYDKERLLRDLLAQAHSTGVEAYSGMAVTGVEHQKDRVAVTAGGAHFDAAYLIGADGANSRVADLAGFNQARDFYCCLLARGFDMKGLRLPEPDILISGITYTAAAPGFMFIFPRPYEDRYTVAFLALEPAAPLDAVARDFMRDSPFFSPWFENAETIGELASSQRILSPVADPCRGRVLLAGDAGACQELENSGAMLCGWQAGLAAAAAVKEERLGIAPRALQDYRRWWKTTYLEKCPHDVYLMNFALPYVIDTAEDLNSLFSFVQEPLAPCWNPYTAIAHIGGLMQRIGPAVQANNPALLAKLAGLSRPMKEVLAAAARSCAGYEAHPH
jgi:flavin-dependent dehydrogenase